MRAAMYTRSMYTFVFSVLCSVECSVVGIRPWNMSRNASHACSQDLIRRDNRSCMGDIDKVRFYVLKTVCVRRSTLS